jgi:hypothetical protein
MQIKKGLMQFEKENTLLIVSGDHEAKFYLAAKGQVDLVGGVEVLNPNFEDNEGKSGRGKKGEGSGSTVKEVNRPGVRDKFIREFLKKAKEEELIGKVHAIYLFSPVYMHSLLEKSLPAEMRKQLKLNVDGNHLRAHPFKLIEMIEKKIPGGKVVVNEKVRKILKKGKN